MIKPVFERTPKDVALQLHTKKWYANHIGCTNDEIDEWPALIPELESQLIRECGKDGYAIRRCLPMSVAVGIFKSKSKFEDWLDEKVDRDLTEIQSMRIEYAAKQKKLRPVERTNVRGDN